MKNIVYNLYSVFQRIFLFSKLGSGSVVKPPFNAWNRQLISIGRNTFIGSNSFFAITPIGNGKPVVSIGKGCCIGSGFFVAAVKDVIIEDNVLLSDRVFISDHIHDYSDTSKPIIKQPLIYKGPVRIKTGAFVGINAVIMPGVTVGSNSVVGASSVVTKDVPDYCVVSGNPAKILKRYNKTSVKWEKIE